MNICGDRTNNLQSSPNIIRVIKSKTIRWAGLMSRTVRREMLTKFRGKSVRKENTWQSHLWMDDTEVDLQEIERKDLHWIDVD